MNDIRKIQGKIIYIARCNLTQHAELHHTEFPAVNSYVLVERRHNSLRKGAKSMLLPYPKGPMKVINSVGFKYFLQDIALKNNKDYHVSRLLDPELYDPLIFISTSICSLRER